MKRVTYVDSAKGLGILFVVTAHLLGVLVLSDPKPLMEPVWKYLCSVTIAFFFVASGFTINITNEVNKPLKEIIKKKFSSILYPYFTCSIIYLFYKIIAFYCFNSKDYKEKDIIDCLLDTITLKGSSVLWFFSALFLGGIFFNILMHKTNRIISFVINLVLSLITLFFTGIFNDSMWDSSISLYILGNLLTTIFRAFVASLFLNIGFELYNLIAKIQKKLIEIVIGIILIASNFVLAQYANVDFANNYYENPALSLICMFTGSIGLMLLCKNVLDFRFLRYLGSKSLTIMVTHIDFKVLPYALSISYALNSHITRAKEYVLYASILVLIIFFEAIWIWMFDHPLKRIIKRKI